MSGPGIAPQQGIRARKLVRDFPGVRALDGLDLDVPPGQLYALVGPNGSGKTTLIRILMGLDEPTRGEATVMGAAPGAFPYELGYMPQEEAIYPDLSVRENIAFFAGLYGMPDPREREREILTLVGLWDDRDRVAGDLSGGMRRRVSLTVALLHRPRVLFLDEPTVGVEPLMRAEFWDEFRELAAAGTCILITTHHVEEARRCDKVGLLWRGRMLREDTPDALLREAGVGSLEDAFGRFVRRAEETA